MPLAGYAWSQIRTWSEIALCYGSDSVWKSYSKQKRENRKSQVLTKLCLMFFSVQLFMASLIARQTSFVPWPVTDE
jgi:hypothetical protein